MCCIVSILITVVALMLLSLSASVAAAIVVVVITNITTIIIITGLVPYQSLRTRTPPSTDRLDRTVPAVPVPATSTARSSVLLLLPSLRQWGRRAPGPRRRGSRAQTAPSTSAGRSRSPSPHPPRRPTTPGERFGRGLPTRVRSGLGDRESSASRWPTTPSPSFPPPSLLL